MWQKPFSPVLLSSMLTEKEESMLKKFLMVVSFLTLPSFANAQSLPLPTTDREAKTFVAQLPPDVWALVAKEMISLSFFKDKPIVAVFNPNDESITSIICDGKWELVGTKPYLRGAPATIPAHKIGFVPTDGFDGYCKISITGVSDNGDTFRGILNGQTFSDSTVISLKKE
jgi:hypothetical protein